MLTVHKAHKEHSFIPKIRVLCFGDSNTWGWVPGKMGIERFSERARWTGIIQKKLGTDYLVIEEGFGGRTTAYDDPRPEMPLRNGLQVLPMLLETYAPIDIIVVMLGTADCKEMMHLQVKDIIKGMEAIIQTIQSFKPINGKTIKNTIIIAPPIVDEYAPFASTLFKGGTIKSIELVKEYKKLAHTYNCFFLDSNDYVHVDPKEGVHMLKESHFNLSLSLTRLIRKASR